MDHHYAEIDAALESWSGGCVWVDHPEAKIGGKYILLPRLVA
jgi:hypothetical protein